MIAEPEIKADGCVHKCMLWSNKIKKQLWQQREAEKLREVDASADCVGQIHSRHQME